MKKKQKYLIVLIIIAILLLGTGLFLLVSNPSTKKLKDNTKSNKDYFDNITGKHCIKNLCIESVEVSYIIEQKQGNLKFKLTNTDKSKKQESGSFTFTPNSSTELIAYYDEIPAGESVDVKITFADKKVINMTDYKLSNLETGTYDKI
jgi:uncharacterized protein YpmS